MWILVLLALVWVAALAPMVIRRVREREIVSAVGSFSRSLSRLSSDDPLPSRSGSVKGAVIGYSAAAQRLSDQRLGSELGAISWGSSRSSGPGTVRPADLGPVISHATAIRRRRVVLGLVVGTVVAFLMGFGVPAFFYLALSGLVISISYLALLAYFHRLAIERAQKVVALETRRGVALALDEARHQSSGPAAISTVRPRMAGSGWSVPQPAPAAQRWASASR